jgi:hypothetical protein
MFASLEAEAAALAKAAKCPNAPPEVLKLMTEWKGQD